MKWVNRASQYIYESDHPRWKRAGVCLLMSAWYFIVAVSVLAAATVTCYFLPFWLYLILVAVLVSYFAVGKGRPK